MGKYRKQKNITISDAQVELIKANVGKMTIEKLATMLGLPFQKTYNNMKVLKLTKQQKRPYRIAIDDSGARVIDIGTNGYFDEKKFAKLYQR